MFGSGRWDRDIERNGELLKPPYIDRWSWYKYFDESFIAYADPTFYDDEDITIGWYVGGEEWYLETIGKIISKIAKLRGIPNNNILFFGSSGGGYASIGLATLIKNSKVMVNNCIFSIKDLEKSHYDNLLRVLKLNFPSLSEDEILHKLNHRIDLIELFKFKNYIPDITYYINTESDEDLKRANLFIKRILELPLSNNLSVHYYQSDNGHGAIETAKTLKIINLYIKVNLYNDEEDFDIKKILKENKELKYKNNKLKKINKEIMSSNSWKITKPLRKLGHQIKK